MSMNNLLAEVLRQQQQQQQQDQPNHQKERQQTQQQQSQPQPQSQQQQQQQPSQQQKLSGSAKPQNQLPPPPPPQQQRQQQQQQQQRFPPPPKQPQPPTQHTSSSTHQGRPQTAAKPPPPPFSLGLLSQVSATKPPAAQQFSTGQQPQNGNFFAQPSIPGGNNGPAPVASLPPPPVPGANKNGQMPGAASNNSHVLEGLMAELRSMKPEVVQAAMQSIILRMAQPMAGAPVPPNGIADNSAQQLTVALGQAKLASIPPPQVASLPPIPNNGRQDSLVAPPLQYCPPVNPPAAASAAAENPPSAASALKFKASSSAKKHKSSTSKESKLNRIPCRARGMPVDHDSETAYFVLSDSPKHGEELVCSFPYCRDRGVKFRYCLYCGIAVAKRSFRMRHHHLDESSSQGGDEKQSMPSSVVLTSTEQASSESNNNEERRRKRKRSKKDRSSRRRSKSRSSRKSWSNTDSEWYHANAKEIRKVIGDRPEVFDEERVLKWCKLLDERPAGDDSDGMSAWLMAVLAVSDVEKSRPKEKPVAEAPPPKQQEKESSKRKRSKCHRKH